MYGEVNNRRSRNFLLSSSPSPRKPRRAKKNIPAYAQTPTRCTHSRSLIQWHKNHSSPPTHHPHLSWCSSCTIIATVIHRCWILLASHKTWYAWFVQSARSVISFSFSFIFPSWAIRSIFLLYESADTQRDFQDDYMPHAMGGLRSQHANLKAVLNLGENIYLNKVLNIWSARGGLHLSYQTYADPQVKLSISRQTIKCF